MEGSEPSLPFSFDTKWVNVPAGSFWLEQNEFPDNFPSFPPLLSRPGRKVEDNDNNFREKGEPWDRDEISIILMGKYHNGITHSLSFHTFRSPSSSSL